MAMVTSRTRSACCLVNAPATGDEGGPSAEEIDACERATFEQLRRCGLALEWIPSTLQRTTPATFETLFRARAGAVRSRDARLAASFQRPGSRSRIPACSWRGSVHPGRPADGGDPGWLAAEAILAQSATRTSISGDPGGYAWWYLDALSPDAGARPGRDRVRRQRVLALLRARAAP